MNPPARMQPPEERCPSNQEHMIFARNAQSHLVLLVAASMEAPSRRAMVTCYSDEAVHCASCSSTRVSLYHKVDELKLSEENRRGIVCHRLRYRSPTSPQILYRDWLRIFYTQPRLGLHLIRHECLRSQQRNNLTASIAQWQSRSKFYLQLLSRGHPPSGSTSAAQTSRASRRCRPKLPAMTSHWTSNPSHWSYDTSSLRPLQPAAKKPTQPSTSRTS